MHADMHVRASTVAGQAVAPRSIEAALAVLADMGAGMPDVWTEGLGGGRMTSDSVLLSPHDLEGDVLSTTRQGLARPTLGRPAAAQANAGAAAAAGAALQLRDSVMVSDAPACTHPVACSCAKQLLVCQALGACRAGREGEQQHGCSCALCRFSRS